MEKSYPVGSNIFKESAFYGLQKIILDNIPRNFYIEVAWYLRAKFMTGYRAKFRTKNKWFPVHGSILRSFISDVLILIHSADPCTLLKACVGCARVQRKTLSNLLNKTSFLLTKTSDAFFSSWKSLLMPKIRQAFSLDGFKSSAIFTRIPHFKESATFALIG